MSAGHIIPSVEKSGEQEGGSAPPQVIVLIVLSVHVPMFEQHCGAGLTMVPIAVGDAQKASASAAPSD